MKVARIENGKVVNIEIFEDGATLSSDLIDVTSTVASIGDTYGADGFVTPIDDTPNTTTYLTVTASSTKFAPNTEITITSEVHDSDGALVLFDKDYYVPIMRKADNFQADLIEVSFVQGVASTKLTVSDKGIYEVKLDMITPEVTAELEENISLIVI